MADCPLCKTPGAYIGFNSVECRNPDCEHFVLFEEEVCPCCGQIGHNSDKHAAAQRQGGSSQDASGSQDAGQVDASNGQVGTVYLTDPTLEPGISGD